MIADQNSPFDALAWLENRKNAKQVDNQGNTLMTTRYLKQICKEQKIYQTPELNDIIYLHFKGFSKIENIGAYFGLKSLYLEGNGISRIENIDDLTSLRCLFLQQNCLASIENLDSLVLLDTLNLSNNSITVIQNLGALNFLSTLQLQHNSLTSYDDIKGLLECPSICVLDLSKNKIDDADIVNILVRMPKLAVLNLMGNPVIAKIQNYRRKVVSGCIRLNYLDDRPVFEKERLACNAWAIGGPEGELKERERIRAVESKEHNDNLISMALLQEKARQTRLENYGIEEPVILSDELEKLRTDMLSKIVDTGDFDTISESCLIEDGESSMANQQAPVRTRQAAFDFKPANLLDTEKLINPEETQSSIQENEEPLIQEFLEASPPCEEERKPPLKVYKILPEINSTVSAASANTVSVSDEPVLAHGLKILKELQEESLNQELMSNEIFNTDPIKLETFVNNDFNSQDTMVDIQELD